MSLSEADQEIINKEIQVVKETFHSLKEQKLENDSKYSIENERARELTSQIVNTRRDEDKIQLASDEAVAHQLRDKKIADSSVLDSLIERPYFARIVLEESVNDRTRRIEYKIGHHANPDCRIIDWRKAPLSKLYYEYKEGDEYAEEIQGQDREGKVLLRHTVEVRRDILKSLASRRGTYRLNGTAWELVESPTSRSVSSTGSHELPNILSLITAEQFRMITEDANTAVIIQGIAGSGKTTVALHRLAWLLHQDNSDLKPGESLVLVKSNALRSYILRVLPSMEIHGVRITTYSEWALGELNQIGKLQGRSPFTIHRQPLSRSSYRLLNSTSLLRALEEESKEIIGTTPIEQILIRILRNPRKILEYDETKLLDTQLIDSFRAELEHGLKTRELPPGTEALLLRLSQLQLTRSKLPVKKYGHIVIDEAQDFSALHFAIVMSSVQGPTNLTVVGDTAQGLDADTIFPGWDQLRKQWGLSDEESNFITLSVSHRSTLPIMQLADYVLGQSRTTTGRPGKPPRWIKCRSQISALPRIIEWLSEVRKRFPTSLSAIICRDLTEAKEALGLLRPTFGHEIRLGDSEVFTFESGIVISDIRSLKGLEFGSVLLWNPGEHSYPDSETGRNALYTAITRAESFLFIATWERHSPLLPPIYSNLVRGQSIESMDY